jgi:hypothetical protein
MGMSRSAARQHAALPALVTALLVLLAAACGGTYVGPDAAVEPFRQAIDEYTGPFKRAAGVTVYRPGAGKPQGYVKGGVVLIEGDQVSPFHDDLPSGLRAATPDDVGTVVLVQARSRKVGEYSSGDPAWQSVWKVAVVDLDKGKVVGSALLRGKHPPFAANIEAGENYGPPPWDDLVAYLKKLPRR